MTEPIIIAPDMALPIQVPPPTPIQNPTMSGGIVTPSNPLYACSRLDFNRKVIENPSYINFCFSNEDVLSALNYARQTHMPFRIRTGRNDYEVNSNVDAGLVIDMSKMHYIQLNIYKRTVKVGGGTLVGEVYRALAKCGYTIPSGTYRDVGLVSLTSTGGIGFASRYLGLTCDYLKEVELITGEGKMIVANTYENPDLFWAIRGGLGANFGVIVSMTYRIVPVQKVTVCEIEWECCYSHKVLYAWQFLQAHMDNRFTSTVKIIRNEEGKMCLRLEGVFWGRRNELVRELSPLLGYVPVMNQYVATVPYEEAIEKMVQDQPGCCAFKGTSSFIYEPLSCETICRLIEDLEQSPLGSWQSLEFKALGGNISKVGADETAYAHREALFLIEIKSIWAYEGLDAEGIQWVNHVKYFLDGFGRGAYRGCTDFNIENWAEQYYGTHYRKLQIVKSQYDPENILHFPQSIQLI
ncbi:FAD-dependent oxidoreductase [Niameybacter sp.]|uniref:FAD-dependent oxidoreductase n=1 Tax=Niameybacter sp. TaxID=2033640 RepID=UPI002FC9263A